MTGPRHSIVLAERPSGTPTPACFRLETQPLPTPASGEVLARVIWLSLDPYMRGRMDDAKSYAPPVALDAVMEGGAVAEVMTSADDRFAPGDIVTGQFGWTTHGVLPANALRRLDPALAPIQTALGVLGMPGLTAWVGLNDILRMQPGETLVVSAATGAVGSLAGQLARARGLNVIGVAGGADKCAYATDKLGYDACLDHRDSDAAALGARLRDAAPNGIDGYFENVGGKTLSAVLPNMNVNARIALCGMIAWYSGRNLDQALPLPQVWRRILTHRLRVEGFIIFDHFQRFPAFLADVGPMVRDGQISYRETVAEGLENAPAAFLKLLDGGNFGKQLVRIGPDPAP